MEGIIKDLGKHDIVYVIGIPVIELKKGSPYVGYCIIPESFAKGLGKIGYSMGIHSIDYTGYRIGRVTEIFRSIIRSGGKTRDAVRAVLYSSTTYVDKEMLNSIKKFAMSFRPPGIPMIDGESVRFRYKTYDITLHYEQSYTESGDSDDYVTAVPHPPFPLEGIYHTLIISPETFKESIQRSLGSFVSFSGHAYYHDVIHSSGLGGCEMTVTELNVKDKNPPWVHVINAYLQGLRNIRPIIRLPPPLETIGDSVYNLSLDSYEENKKKLEDAISYVTSSVKEVSFIVECPSIKEFGNIVSLMKK